MRHRPLLAFGIAVLVPVVLAACDGGGPSATSSPTLTVVSTATPAATPAPASTAEPATTPTTTDTLAPSPTPETVLSPCEFVPDLPTTVSDQSNLYSISAPDGWVKVMDDGASDIASDMRISRIYVESPDFSMSVDMEAEGPVDPVYYETGAGFGILVTTPISSPYHSQEVISESNVAIDGVNAPYHVFVEPSIRVGQLLDAHVNHGGSDYLFFFGYNPETCPAGEDIFRAMLDTFQFN